MFGVGEAARVGVNSTGDNDRRATHRLRSHAGLATMAMFCLEVSNVRSDQLMSDEWRLLECESAEQLNCRRLWSCAITS